jgi:hypothetical protein
MTEPFLETTGVKQGCLLSPLPFPLVIDLCSRTAYDSPTGMQRTITSSLEGFNFADDICNLSHRLQHSQH